MPIISIFPTGSGGSGGGGGIPLGAVSDIATVTSSGKVHIKWSDPEDIVVGEATLAKWAGTLLVRKEGSTPANRRDGDIVVDSKTRNAYKNQYYVDEGLTNGKDYYYKFFPYTTSNNYTEDIENEFNASPNAVPPGDVSNLAVVSQLHERVSLTWTDPAETIVQDDVTVSTWASTKVVYKTDSYPTSPDDGTLVINSVTWNAHESSPLEVTGLTNGTTYYFALFPISTDGAVNTNTVSRITATPNKTKISDVPSQNGVLTYTGAELTPTWNNYNSTQLTIDGTVIGIDAGTYSATFTPTEDYCWSDGTTTAQTVTWTIDRATLTVPTQSGSLIYNGSEQSPTWNNYDSTKMTIDGTIKSTNAGTFTAIFTPGMNYKWPDGTTTAQTVDWVLDKAAGSLTLSKSSVTLNTSILSDTVTITKSGAGAITVTSSNTNIATVSLSGNTITIDHVNQTSGTATIIVSVASDDNHNAPTDEVISVSAEFVPAKAALNSMTWTNIRTVIDAGFAEDYWDVGDAKQITVNGTIGSTAVNMSVWAFIIGINHNSAREGANKVHFQLGKNAEKGTQICFVDSSYGSYNANNGSFTMNPAANSSGSKNAGGWNASHMRKTLLGGDKAPTSPTAKTFLAALPSDLRAVIKSCTKYSDNTGGGSNTASYVTATTDYLWLLAEFEVQGARSYANSAEQNYQKQYDYYKSGNSKVFYRHSSVSSTAYWWLRSVLVGNSYSFCSVYTDGGANANSSGHSYGVSPGFCV